MASHPEMRQARRFAALLAVVLTALAALAWWRQHPVRASACLAGAALAPILAWLLPAIWVRVVRLWMTNARVLGGVMSRAVLTVFYCALLTPYGMIARIFRTDPLDLDWKRRKASYWIDRPPQPPERERYERQY